MRLQEVEKCKEECDSVMRKLAGVVRVVLSICELCEKAQPERGKTAS